MQQNDKLFNETEDLCSVIAFELQKLYPNIKIPVDHWAEYYLNQLARSPEFVGIREAFNMVKDLVTLYGEKGKKGDWSAHEYKMRYVGKMKTLFEEKGWTEKINKTFPSSEIKLTKIGFEPEDGKLYMSVDLRQSNFNTLKHVAGLGVGPTATWEDFVDTHFPDMHPALKNSKSYRQLLFGNLNPSRTASLTAGITAYYVSLLPDTLQVVGTNNDEIIIRIQEEQSIMLVIEELDKVAWMPEVPVKFTPYMVEFEGEGIERVRVDTVIALGEDLLYKDSYLKLVGVPGNLYHRNFAKHVLDKELEYEDSLFQLDGRTAQWLI